MAVQLILKNSSVQDKEATALQLANGEIALNYHQSGPFLQCKDSNGDVWRIGGVIIGANAPSSPSKGAWWFNASTDVLKFYDGSTWNEIFVNSIVDGDIDANAEIAVSKLADGTARQLLQTDAAGTGVEWTDNVDVPGTLDVTGVATFDNNVVITGNLTVNGTTTTIDTTTLIVEDKNIEMGSVDSPTDVTADGGGLTLKGATDKTFNWVNSTDSWTSSENVDLASGKTYKVNGTDVLSGSSLGSGVTGSSLTSVGTITSGTWNGTTVATGSGGTGQTTYTNGQLLIGKTDGTLNKATLTAGTNISITNSDGGIEIATSGAGINNVVEDTTPQLGGDLDVQTHAINTSTTDGDIDLDANGAGLIQVTEFNLSQVPIVTQHDIGTAANEVPLNGMLGGMAFQDPASVSVDDITVTDTADINGLEVDSSGRVGIQDTPSTAIASYLQIGPAGAVGSDHSFYNYDTYLANNAYKTGNNQWSALTTRSSAVLQLDNNEFIFKSAGSTTADSIISLTEKLRVQSGGGISFNGDTAAANALDDYEEGTWTVNVYDAASGGNVSVTTTTGYYTKIGRCVSCLFTGITNIDTTGMTAGNLVYVSLPFVSSLSTSALPGGTLFLEGLTLPASNTYVTPVLSYGHGRFLIYTGGASGGPRTALTVGNLTSGTTDFRYFQMTYFI